eukprot:scpid37023/ scgid9609/ 
MVSMQLYSRLPDHLSLSKSSLPRLQSVNGSPVSVLGKLSVSVTVGGRAFRHDVLVADIQPELVLGLDFLDLHACILDTSNRRLTFEPVPASNNACRLDNNTPPPFPANCRVRLTESICIQPFSQVILPVVCDAPLPTGDFLLEPRPDLHAVFDISATYSVVLGPLAEPVPLRAASTHQASVTLKKGTWVATVSPCSVDPESSAPADALPVHATHIGYDGTVHTKPRLQVGAEVSVFSPVVPKGKSPKLHSYWSGPFVVRKVLDSVTATIEDASKGQRLTVHVNRLKPYIRPPEVPVAPAQYTAQINPTCDDDLPVPLAGPPPRYNLRPRNALQRPHRYRQP